MRALFVALVLLLPARAHALPDVTAPGPYPVGFVQMTFTKLSETTGEPRELDTWIWYPAAPGTGTPGGTGLLDAAVAKGRWPLIVFSHGSCGFPGQSIGYTKMLASWGFVVAVPPHPGNTTFEIPECGAGSRLIDSYLNRVADVQFVIDRMLAESKAAGSRFARRVHRRRIGMTGHSFGGLTTLRVLAAEPRVRAGVALAPAAIGNLDEIMKPAMIMTGEVDSITPFDANSRIPYEEILEGPRFLVEILDAGHCAFAVACFANFCGAGCPPEGISQEEALTLTLRYAVPFFLRYVAGNVRFGRALRSAAAPAGVRVVAQPKR